ncbi:MULTISPECIES: chromate efflux transporter [unclassified Nostoc]|uniref:chromate efflux transporter n=1 Tax=unclassified Nostoc TaxID=2593658 RepID=UPI002627A4D9|nr:chromate efflux transporter [Nostoc sp. S13]MDF5738426.1 chromate efflux transporter [Nostoc sp. S13]
MTNSAVSRLGELANLFFKLGVIGFGGPVAHIAMIEDEVVKQRQWLTRENFLDLLGATNLIPGPNSTEMAIHIGYIYAGWLGLIVSGVCFILPAVIITGGFAWVYVAYGTLPQVAPLLYGIKPAVLAIIINALWGLGKKAVKTRQLLVIALAVALLTLLFKLNEVIALLIGGLLGMLWLHSGDKNDKPRNKANFLIASLSTGATLKALPVFAASVATVANVSLWELGWFFLKVGSVLFGGGYLLVAFLQGGLVEEYGWLTQQQLLDAIAIGQFTPGPVLSTATFIGYIIAGIPGAIVATIGIFLPSFVFVAALNHLIPRLRASSWTRAFLDAVNVSAVALMVITTLQLGAATLILPQAPFIDFLGLAIAIVSAILVIRLGINAAWLVFGSALIGWGASLLGYTR